MSRLYSISPITGRYRDQVEELEAYFSEFAFIRYRLLVEVEYFIALLSFLGKKKLSPAEKKRLRSLYQRFSLEDAERVKALEKEINHDTKAVEYFFKELLQQTGLGSYKEFAHFGLTSNDITDNASSLALRGGLKNVLLPEIKKIYETLKQLAKRYRQIPMLARTHGQPASPTTVGKEFANFAARARRQINMLENFKFPGKIGGAVGNYNAQFGAYPRKNWPQFAKKFVASLGLEPVTLTTQIVPKEAVADFLHSVEVLNNIILDLDQDMWLYISFDYFRLKTREGEVGSSTMPHKVNPIDFENSEGNIIIANSLLHAIAGKIQISRLQRDLSDSTVSRNYGTALSHSLLAYKSTLRGLAKIAPNREVLEADLESHPEVISEGIQTILRREGYEAPYEKLKELTRGKDVSLKSLQDFISGLSVTPQVKKELLSITTQTYTGLASRLVDLA